jgi:hypothetical protein
MGEGVGKRVLRLHGGPLPALRATLSPRKAAGTSRKRERGRHGFDLASAIKLFLSFAPGQIRAFRRPVEMPRAKKAPLALPIPLSNPPGGLFLVRI